MNASHMYDIANIDKFKKNSNSNWIKQRKNLIGSNTIFSSANLCVLAQDEE